MADDTTTQRSFRSSDPYSGNAASSSVDAAANDPLAELARLIGQSDPFAEFGSEARRPTPSAAQAQPAYRMDAREPHGVAAPPQHSQHDDASYAASPNPDDHDYYQDEMQAPPDDYYAEPSSSRRRVGIMAIAGVFALGVIGTAGAFGYRALFGPGGSSMPPPVIKADTSPSKIVPQTGADAKAGGKVIYDRVGDRGQGEKVVSREETPIDIKSKSNGVIPPAAAGDENGGAGGAMQAMAGDASFAEPKKIHTIVIRPDQPDMGLPAPAPSGSAPPSPPPPSPRIASAPETRVADAQPQQTAPEPPRHASSITHRAEPAPHRAQAAPRNAPLSLSPGDGGKAPAAKQPMRAANAPAAAVPAHSGATHGEYVQVSSQRSEADAQASFRTLQNKYPKQLGGRQLVIHRADLGAKGVYYRALVGPFASASEAVQLCSSLKAAGGSCLIQRN